MWSNSSVLYFLNNQNPDAVCHSGSCNESLQKESANASSVIGTAVCCLISIRIMVCSMTSWPSQAPTHGVFSTWLKNPSSILRHTFTHFPHGSLFLNKTEARGRHGPSVMSSSFPEITAFSLTSVTFHRSVDRALSTQEPANYALMMRKHFGWTRKHTWHHFEHCSIAEKQLWSS